MLPALPGPCRFRHGDGQARHSSRRPVSCPGDSQRHSPTARPLIRAPVRRCGGATSRAGNTSQRPQRCALGDSQALQTEHQPISGFWSGTPRISAVRPLSVSGISGPAPWSGGNKRISPYPWPPPASWPSTDRRRRHGCGHSVPAGIAPFRVSVFGGNGQWSALTEIPLFLILTFLKEEPQPGQYQSCNHTTRHT